MVKGPPPCRATEYLRLTDVTVSCALLDPSAAAPYHKHVGCRDYDRHKILIDLEIKIYCMGVQAMV